MTWFDLAALVVVGLAVFDGAKSGLAWAALELVLLVLASLVATSLRTVAEPYLLKVAVLSKADLPWTTHAVLFAMASCLFLGLLYLLRPTAKKWRFRHDRWAGGVFGVLTGVLATLILFSFAVWSSPRPYESELRQSWLADGLVAGQSQGLQALFPVHLPHRLEDLRHN